jgi:hypothetical protein
MVATAACAHLEGRGIRCWIAPRDPIPGIPYGRQLVDAIAQTRVVILIFSSHANASEAVLSELELAHKRGKNIIPFRIELVLPEGDLEYYIQRVHWLDAMTPPMEKRLDELVTLVQRILESAPAPAPAASPAEVAASERVLIEAAPSVAVAPPAVAPPAAAPPAAAPPADRVPRLTVSAIAVAPVRANATMAFSYEVPVGGSEKEQVDFVDSHGNARPAVVSNRQRVDDEVSGQVDVPSDAKAGEAMRLRVSTWDAAGQDVCGFGPSFVIEPAAVLSLPAFSPRTSMIAAGSVVLVLALVFGAFALSHRSEPKTVAQATPFGVPGAAALTPPRLYHVPPGFGGDGRSPIFSKGAGCTSSYQRTEMYNDSTTPAYFDLYIQEHDSGEQANFMSATPARQRSRLGSGETALLGANVPVCKSSFFSWFRNMRFTPDDTGPVALP